MYISDKILSTSPYYNTYHEAGTKDWSDPMDSAYYESLARLRHPRINDHITFYAGDSLVSGEAPEWAADASCPLLSLENGDFLTSTGRDTTYHFCTSADLNTAPVVTFDTPADTIYTGEDYVAFPAITDAEGDSVTLSMDYSGSTATWFEVGTPANYLELSDWPHPNNKSLYYVRSSYQEVRQKQLETPGTYHYNLVATDKLGASDTVSRIVVVLPVSAHPSASGKSLAVLAGDETWFLKYQLDVATGIVNFSGSDIVLENYYYDWYGTKAEAATIHPNAWYSNGGFTPTYTDCGNDHYRIRYTYAGKDTIWGGYSFFDNKYGLVYGTTVRMNKLDDYSMLPFVGDTLRRRRYDPDVTLYNGDGTLLWGSAPAWAGDCQTAAPSSSSSGASSSSAVPGSSSSGSVHSSSSGASSSSSARSSSSGFSAFRDLAVRFYDGDAATSNAVALRADVVNKGSSAAGLGGYRMRFYYNATDSCTAPDSVVYNVDYAEASFDSVYTERCGADEYALTFAFGASASAPAGGSSGAAIGRLHSAGYGALDKEAFASWLPSSSLAEDPRMALFDARGNLVYGTEAWTCDGYREKELKLSVKEMVKGGFLLINKGVADVSLEVNNAGDSSLAGPAYVDFYVTHPAGRVPVFVYGKDTLSVAGSMRLGDGLTVTRLSSGDRHVYTFRLEGGIPAKSSTALAFKLYDQCLLDCASDDSSRAYYSWDVSDDWSAFPGSLHWYNKVVTDRVTVTDARGAVLYGKADPSAPSYAVEVNSAGDTTVVIRQSRPAAGGAQNPNRTDAVAYSGGQLLSGGDFENPSLLGWTVTADSVHSVRGPAPQGSRYLRLSAGGSVSQALPPSVRGILADSGAVLLLWHKGAALAVSLAGSVRTLAASSSWRQDTLAFAKTQFAASGTYSVSLSGGADVDDAELVPGTRAAPATYAVRFTTTQHEELETRAYDGDRQLLITSSQRDAMGRPWKKFLPFALPCAGILDCNSEGKTLRNPSMANSYYV
ncbi:MAG: hypothetical protein WCS71_01490, partial [Sphaerochaetaceae bacterium]